MAEHYVVVRKRDSTFISSALSQNVIIGVCSVLGEGYAYRKESYGERADVQEVSCGERKPSDSPLETFVDST